MTKKIKKYSARWFLAKFKSIPDSKWTIGTIGNMEDPSLPRCALGHCGGYNTEEAQALIGLLNARFKEDVTDINDRTGSKRLQKRFRQKTPKARILAALNSFIPKKTA